jgi:ubiquinone/menaquinone biosynthesis C-methylase UbiE
MAHHLHHRSHQHGELTPATRGRLIRWARYYDPCVSLLTLGRRTRLRRTTVALAHIRPGERVLEVGCGTGDVALVAKAQAGPGGVVSGIDASPEMIAVARAKAAHQGVAVDFQVGLIEALAFPDAIFDVVLSSLMMHHLPDDLKRQGLAEIARVLKPGGRLLIVDAKHPTNRLGRGLATLLLHGSLSSGVQDLPPLLQAAGFTGVEVGETGFRTLGFVRGQVDS